MGEVYRARDERLGRDVAVKILPEKVAQNSVRLARFDQEAKAVAKLSHPNILEIFDVGREHGISFVVTELLEGGTLREHLFKSGGPLPWRQVREVGSGVANGLSAAHDHGVVHRDLKPANIFVCSDGRVKILDFGLASIEQAVDTMVETGSIQAPLTHQGTVMGTVGYMAPEQVRGERADSRADIFALGCVLYEMLTGQQAFKRDTTAEIMTAILREEPRSFDEFGVEVAPAVAKTVLRCMEKNPERRFQSASDLAFALEAMTGSKNPYNLGICELFVNRPRAAVAALSRIPYPTDEAPASQKTWAFCWLAKAHHMLGEYEQELLVAEESLSYFPSDDILQGHKAGALAALGQIEKIDQVVEDTALVQDDPVVMRVMLQAAGELRAHGRREAAVLMAGRTVDWFKTVSSERQKELQPVLADALIHAERWAEAMRLLKKAVSQGYLGFWGIRADINLEPLWDNPDFLELMRPKG